MAGGAVLEDQSSESDMKQCFVCHSALGKRHFKPKHICGLCGKAVCSACSPSSLQFEDNKNIQRGCTPCVSAYRSVASCKGKIRDLGEKLHALSDSTSADDSGRRTLSRFVKSVSVPCSDSIGEPGSCVQQSEDFTFDDAFDFCELQLLRLQDAMRELPTLKERLAVAEASAEFEIEQRKAAERLLQEVSADAKNYREWQRNQAAELHREHAAVETSRWGRSHTRSIQAASTSVATWDSAGERTRCTDSRRCSLM
eukprot:TRINITY_DN50314_c0_g1_i1.p1 TRINITY_DN50314_c0_g1~~TRINITY_DN50314_c0_g1_i1.p1  ORF type:complete len:273 (+),score=32.51 TRINITY_DN50314_c0_g1_i1:55-819(+)